MKWNDLLLSVTVTAAQEAPGPPGFLSSSQHPPSHQPGSTSKAELTGSGLTPATHLACSGGNEWTVDQRLERLSYLLEQQPSEPSLSPRHSTASTGKRHQRLSFEVFGQLCVGSESGHLFWNSACGTGFTSLGRDPVQFLPNCYLYGLKCSRKIWLPWEVDGELHFKAMHISQAHNLFMS